jgi:NADPH:quinone reductase
MKAIRVNSFGEPEVMKIETIPDLQPGVGEVVITVKAVGVNPVDTYFRSGMYRPDLSLPYTPGLDAAGIVLSVGPAIKHLQVGQRVYVTRPLTGTYAEQVLSSESHVYQLPDKMSFSQGAAIGVPYGAAFRSLFQRAHALPGETVLIHGASGAVGLAAVQLARSAGMRVIGTAGSEAGIKLVLEQGAHHALNHHEPGYMDQLGLLTCGGGINVILEMLANVNLDKDLDVLAIGGRIVVIGSRGRVEIDPRKAMGKEAAIMGMTLFNASTQDQKSMHAAFFAGLENGTLRPVITCELPLEEAPKAHHAVMESSTLGKIVLIP